MECIQSLGDVDHAGIDKEEFHIASASSFKAALDD